MIFLYGFILTLVAFIAIGAPVFRSIEHTILFRYPGSIFSTWPKWLQRFLLGHRKPGGTNDGFHWGSGLNDLGCVLTGAIIVSLVGNWFWAIGMYVFAGGAQPSFWMVMRIPIAVYIWALYYYFVYQSFFHIGWQKVPDRKVWQCIPGMYWLYEKFTCIEYD